MGRTGKWLKKFFLVGKKEREEKTTPTTLSSTKTQGEKRRWSFRRPWEPKQPACSYMSAMYSAQEADSEQKKHALAVAAATAAAADAAAAAAQAAAAVIWLTAGAAPMCGAVEEAAAIRIQSVYRSYLARKALRALRGLVKLQALVRGHLVRRRAAKTLRCMQAMETAQAWARDQRIRTFEQSRSPINPRKSPTSTHRRSSRDDPFRRAHHGLGGYSDDKPQRPRRAICRLSAWMSPRTSSGRFEDYNYDALCMATSSPQCYSARSNIDTGRAPFWSPKPDYAEPNNDFSVPPNYMAETKSSRAKARSQSAPRQRTVECLERLSGTARRKRNDVPQGAAWMQRSTSLLGSTAARNRRFPWSIRLDRSDASLRDSECESTGSTIMDPHYFGSPLWYKNDGNKYNNVLPPPSPHGVA
ncbi:hypothetical protein SAY86_027682 [Trapa natans]|uniref:DUF4005 domain-containing protein n=1 Tax=Trapa natans TaxID=22666 RepID=A0AAN7QJ71_TRANT|nr:hypothetical protein SAY86_027682 [Trapa natans]